MADDSTPPPDSTAAILADQKARLGPRDPMEVLRSTVGVVEGLIASRSVEVWKRRPAPDQWSPNDVLAHLADMEWVFGFRARTMYADDRPELVEIDQNAWNEARRADEAHPAELLSAFDSLRDVNMRFWRRVRPEDLDRTGHLIATDLTVSLRDWRLFQAGHDLRHLEQIQRALTAAD